MKTWIGPVTCESRCISRTCSAIASALPTEALIWSSCNCVAATPASVLSIYLVDQRADAKVGFVHTAGSDTSTRLFDGGVVTESMFASSAHSSRNGAPVVATLLP